MKGRKNARKLYSGELAKPIELLPVGGFKYTTPSQWRLARDKKLVEDLKTKLQLLFGVFDLDEDDFAGLAVALAYEHVPGMRIGGGKKVGRPEKWTYELKRKLLADVKKQQVALASIKVDPAIRALAKDDFWKKELASGNPYEAIRAVYYQCKRK